LTTLSSTRKNPPGPHTYIPLESTRKAIRNQILFHSTNQSLYGDIVRFRFLFQPATVLTHPDYAKHVLQQNHPNYDKNISPINALKVLLGEGLFTNNSPSWLHQRRLMQPLFHHKNINGLATIMSTTALELAESWKELTQTQRCIDMPLEMKNYMLRAIGKTLFSVDLKYTTQIIEDHMKSMFHALHSYVNIPFPPLSVPTPRNQKIKHAVDSLDAIIYEIITEYQQREEGNDLLALLLAARDDNNQAMTNKQVRDELMTLLLGGHETTSYTLAWIWYVLSIYPDVEKRLHEELETVLNGQPPTLTQMPQLHYLDLLLKEVLRLYTPAFVVARRAVQDDEIGGYFIPKNSYMFVLPYFIHQHPDFWDKPEIFDPERFLPERSQERPKFAYLPFGGGPHVCIGNSFAEMEIKMTIATLAQRYQARLTPFDHPVEPKVSLTMTARYGLPMTIYPR
jgi:cytochrome P450